MKDEIPLGVVNEEAEDELDNSTQKMTPMVHSSLQSGFASPISKLSLHELSDVKVMDSFNKKDQQLSQTKVSSEPIESDNWARTAGVIQCETSSDGATAEDVEHLLLWRADTQTNLTGLVLECTEETFEGLKISHKSNM